MNYFLFLFLLLTIGQSALFAQPDSIKKSFKPYGLIDAAPVAIDKADFRPDISIFIKAIDAISGLPVEAHIVYYTPGDSILSMAIGKAVSVIAKNNETIVIVSNAAGYIWQTQLFNAPDTDTSYILKFTRIKKGDIITKHPTEPDSYDNKFESHFHSQLVGLQGFLKINPNVNIQMYICQKRKEEVSSFLTKNNYKKRFRLKNCRNPNLANFDTITIKILSI